jgi:hypothetical protein
MGLTERANWVRKVPPVELYEYRRYDYAQRPWGGGGAGGNGRKNVLREHTIDCSSHTHTIDGSSHTHNRLLIPHTHNRLLISPSVSASMCRNTPRMLALWA